MAAIPMAHRSAVLAAIGMLCALAIGVLAAGWATFSPAADRERGEPAGEGASGANGGEHESAQ